MTFFFIAIFRSSAILVIMETQLVLACACYLIAQLGRISISSRGGGATKNILLTRCSGVILSVFQIFFFLHAASAMLRAELRGSLGRQLIDAAGGAVNIIKKVLYCTCSHFFFFFPFLDFFCGAGHPKDLQFAGLFQLPVKS